MRPDSPRVSSVWPVTRREKFNHSDDILNNHTMVYIQILTPQPELEHSPRELVETDLQPPVFRKISISEIAALKLCPHLPEVSSSARPGTDQPGA